MSDTDEKPLDPQAQAFLVKMRRLMAIATLTTFLAVAVVLGIVSYRFFRYQESAPPVPPGPPVPTAPDALWSLPAGARVLATTVGDGKVVLTVEAGGAIELRSFDLVTLRPLGRVRLPPAP